MSPADRLAAATALTKRSYSMLGSSPSSENQMNEKQISLLAAFAAAKVEYAVVGGVAVNVHGYVRAHQRLDIFIRQQQKMPAPHSTPCSPSEFRSKA